MSTANTFAPVLAGIEPSIVRAMVVEHTNCSHASGPLRVHAVPGRRAPRPLTRINHICLAKGVDPHSRAN